MEKMELFHFHKEGNYDKLWQVNRTFDVTPSFKSTTFKRFQSFTTAVPIDEGLNINLYDLIPMALSNPNLSREDLIELLKLSYQVSFSANEFKRESALEQYRKDHNPNLPSRLHSMYFTDEEGLRAWVSKFGNANLKLYRVEVVGNIFKTNEQLLPLETYTYQEIYDGAYQYWNPNFKKVPSDSNEYLAQGKVKILEKIK